MASEPSAGKPLGAVRTGFPSVTPSLAARQKLSVSWVTPTAQTESLTSRRPCVSEGPSEKTKMDPRMRKDDERVPNGFFPSPLRMRGPIRKQTTLHLRICKDAEPD